MRIMENKTKRWARPYGTCRRVGETRGRQLTCSGIVSLTMGVNTGLLKSPLSLKVREDFFPRGSII